MKYKKYNSIYRRNKLLYRIYFIRPSGIVGINRAINLRFALNMIRKQSKRITKIEIFYNV